MRVKPVPRSRDAPLSTVPRWITLADTESDLTVPGYSRLIDSPDVANAVGMVADIISDATIWLMENTDEGDKRLKNELSRMIDITPYSLGTRQTWVSWIVTTMFTSGDGNAFVLPVSRNGRIEELLPMPGATTLPQDNGLSYSIQWRGQMFAPDDVLHFRLHPDPAAPWRGRGPRVQLREVLKNLRQAAATTNAFMSSRWMPSVIIKLDSNSEELRDPSGREKLMHEYIQTQRAGEPWMIPTELMDVVTVKPLSLADIAISSSVEMDKRCVAAAIRVPPYFLGVGEYSEAAYNNFIRTTAQPIANGIAQELTKKLLISERWYWKFNTRRLYAYDLKTLASVGDDQYVRGIMTGNEVRDWLDLPPEPGLDERVILENYIPAGMIGNQKKLQSEED